MTRQPVTVLVGDPLPLFRDALARLVRQGRDLTLVAELGDGQGALRAIEALRPDVALLGVPLGDFPADRVAGAVARDGLPTKVILLLGEPDAEAAYTALARGASACLTRAVDPATLCRTVEAAARGENVLAAELQTGVAREIRRRDPDHRPLLTARERQVLHRVADGRSTAQIARALHISPTTVKTHLGNAYEKLGVNDRAAAVAAGMRRGLLE